MRVYIHEQLGNQMFQYAAARRISLHNKTDLYLDTSFFGRRKNGYMLAKFNINATEINSFFHLLLVKLKIRKQRSVLYSSLPRGGGGHSFNSEILEVPNKYFLYGMFQSYFYFDCIRDVLLEDFSLKENYIEEENFKTKELIELNNSISVHIRRGDYLNSNELNVCSLAYYKKAIKFFLNKFNNPKFFIFSDDIEYCKKNLNFSDLIFVSNNNPKKSMLSDFQLMQLCKHHIISNSTFSWWAAYLSHIKNNNIVVAPYKWDIDEKWPIKEKLLPSWVKIYF